MASIFNLIKQQRLENYKQSTTPKTIDNKNENRRNFFGGDSMVTNPLISLKEIELRDLCRHHIDLLEQWSRRIIDETFKDNYGKNYIDAEVLPGQPLIKSSIKRTISERAHNNPGRFPRWIDGIVMENIEYFICRDDLYDKHYKKIFEPFYSGKEELRSILSRLTSIRNKLSHGNSISIHEAEQSLCYSNDFIECLKKYYSLIGKARDYNVPLFLRFKDSHGNDIIRQNTNTWPWNVYYTGTHGDPSIVVRSGDTLKAWVEIDSSFPENSYELFWIFECGNDKRQGKGDTVQITFENKHVSYWFHIKFYLQTKNTWHRCAGTYDDILEMSSFHDVLPPIETTY